MQSDVPKQYLTIDGRTILEYSLSRLLELPCIKGTVVCIHAEDARWPNLRIQHRKLLGATTGGDTRAESVMNGLCFLQNLGSPNDWVLVHDGVRPCVTRDNIQTLVDEVRLEIGGLLAVPITDTVKRVDRNRRVNASISREQLWLAQTPQLFKLGPLQRALSHALTKNASITDEASAMELDGHRPKVIRGRLDNIKVTTPEDLDLVSYYLHKQERKSRLS